MYWLRWYSHDEDIAGALYKTKQNTKRTEAPTISSRIITITATRFTIHDKYLIKWMLVKKYMEKRLLKMFLTKDEILIG